MARSRNSATRPKVLGLVSPQYGPPLLDELERLSRFVVVPLLPSDTDNGCTAILEAKAMDKAVLCSATTGPRDVLMQGEA